MQDEKEFLPTNYKVPKKPSNYVKFPDGQTVKIRIMTAPVRGWVAFDAKNKPHRKPEAEQFTREELDKISEGKPKKEKGSHFFAMIAYDYESKDFKVLEITQSGIKEDIMGFLKDEELGDPRGYDIKITRNGTGIESKYRCVPSTVKPVDAEILEAFSNLDYKLENVFENKDVF